MPVSIDDLEDALTPGQVADILGRGRAAVWRLCRSGQLEYIRVGTGRGRILITRRMLTAYLNQQHHQQP